MDYTSFSPVPIQGRPWDAVAGVDASRQDQMVRMAQAMALQGEEQRQQRQQAELSRYLGQTPNELAKSDLEGMLARTKQSTPGYGSTMAQGDMGTAMTNYANGQFNRDTREGKTRATNTQSANSEFDEAATLFNKHLPLIETASQQGPLAGQMAYTQFRESLPDHAKNIFPTQFSPAVMQSLKGVMTNIINSPAHQRDMAKVDKEGQIKTGVANIGANATIESADIRGNATIEASLNRMGYGSAASQKIESVINKGLMKMMNGEELSPAEQRAFTAAQQILYQARAAASGADPTVFKYNFLNTPSGQPQPYPARPIPSPVNPQADLNLQRQVEGLGERYDPQNYEYKVENGKVLKRKK